MPTAGQTRGLAAIDASDVRQAYRRWAPVYDRTFGKFVEAAVRTVTARANRFSGRLLEVGVGTGLALPHYEASLKVTGIDLSPDMLALARARVARHGQGNVEALIEMDATALAFPDDSFDVTAAMFVMTVVPDPVAVMCELARVTKPGGTILTCNHFSVEAGSRALCRPARLAAGIPRGGDPRLRGAGIGGTYTRQAIRFLHTSGIHQAGLAICLGAWRFL